MTEVLWASQPIVTDMGSSSGLRVLVRCRWRAVRFGAMQASVEPLVATAGGAGPHAITEPTRRRQRLTERPDTSLDRRTRPSPPTSHESTSQRRTWPACRPARSMIWWPRWAPSPGSPARRCRASAGASTRSWRRSGPGAWTIRDLLQVSAKLRPISETLTRGRLISPSFRVRSPNGQDQNVRVGIVGDESAGRIAV